MSVVALTLRFFRRTLADRFAGSFSGGLWALFQPLLQLAITSFVFVHVFKARVPGTDTLGYVPFLAIALWPWTAFSEAVLRSTTVIQDNAALIGKVALPREVLVVASVATSFAIHMVGFVAIVLILAVTGQGIHLAGFVPAILLYIPLCALALGFALIFAAVQVFVRDLAQALGQVLSLLMFGAPVYYDRVQLPEQFRGWLDANPFTFYVESFRALLLDHGDISMPALGIAMTTTVAVLWVGHRVFRRLDAHFEDFL
ncbi:MAG: ABC transporter permease [Rhodanobacter sp.]|jgi:lipopolysaccharide transport system permease protein|nr:ABC transporter permease [Rhodanobacter sp.]